MELKNMIHEMLKDCWGISEAKSYNQIMFQRAELSFIDEVVD
jgi:hypothetical protein